MRPYILHTEAGSVEVDERYAPLLRAQDEWCARHPWLYTMYVFGFMAIWMFGFAWLVS